jgi:hypothetical protein
MERFDDPDHGLRAGGRTAIARPRRLGQEDSAVSWRTRTSSGTRSILLIGAGLLLCLRIGSRNWLVRAK